MSDRGIKKWAPFSALPEQNIYLKTVKENRYKEEEIILSEDQIEEINYILTNYTNKVVTITYFDNKIKQVSGIINKINANEDYLLIEKKKLKISSIKKIMEN